MKHYISENFELCGEKIELFYDTINNELIANEDYACLDVSDNMKGQYLTVKKVKSYFVASDETGIGIRTEFEGKEYTTYYEDEEWCEIFASSEDLEYYDIYYKNEIIKYTISFNILMLNNELKATPSILDNVTDIRLRNENRELVGIAKQGIFVCRDNYIYMLLNKIITNNLNNLDFTYVTAKISDSSEVDLAINHDRKKMNNAGFALVKLKLDRRFSDVIRIDSYPIPSSDPDGIDDLPDEIEGLDLTNKEINMIINEEGFELTNERREALKVFNSFYHIFDRNIDIVSYLLS